MPVARYRERLQAASVVTISLDEHDARDNDDDSMMLADNAPDPTPWTRPRKPPVATQLPDLFRKSAALANALAWSWPCTTRTR